MSHEESELLWLDMPTACERCGKSFTEGENVMFDAEMYVVHPRCARRQA